MSTLLMPLIQSNITPLVVTFFQNKSAISSDNAINLSKTDWISVGFLDIPTERELSFHPYIKKVDDKFWLDIAEVEKYSAKQKIQAPTIHISLTQIIVFLIVIGLVVTGIYLFNTTSR